MSKKIKCQHCQQKLTDIKFLNDQQTICEKCYLNSQPVCSADFNRKQLLNNNKVHIDDPLAITNLNKIINRQLKPVYKPVVDKLLIFCIGTDRSTGDALGPLVGSKLSNFKLKDGVEVFGTLDNPVHATNMKKKIKQINQHYNNPLIIAIDAGLGKNKSVGSINVNPGPLKPGSGVDKKLPEIGDLHITGLVNVGGYMEYFVLQSTRLSLVVKMAKIIAYSLVNSIKQIIH